ncbi:MAG: MFS transporter [Thermodesulfobacteriota bacterium]
MKKLYLDTNLQLMGGVTLMVIMGVSSIMPVLPTLMRELGVSPGSIGLVITAFTLPGVILSPVAGVLADRLGRKRILVGSLVVFGVFGAACSLAPDFETLLYLRFLQGIGVAPIGVLNTTVIGDLYEGEDRVRAMGFSAIVLSVGTASLPALGGFLALWGWQYAFLLPLSSLALAILVQLFLDNPEPRATVTLKEYMKGTFSAMAARTMVALFVITLLTHIILYGPYVTYLPILLEERFLLSPAYIGLISSIASVFTALASSQVGRLAGRFRSIALLCASSVLLFLSMAVVPFLSSLWAFALPVALLGASMGLGAPVRIALLAELSPMDSRGAIMSVNSMLLRLGQTIGPVLMGLVFAEAGMDWVYWTGTFAALAMFAVTLGMSR